LAGLGFRGVGARGTPPRCFGKWESRWAEEDRASKVKSKSKKPIRLKSDAAGFAFSLVLLGPDLACVRVPLKLMGRFAPQWSAAVSAGPAAAGRYPKTLEFTSDFGHGYALRVVLFAHTRAPLMLSPTKSNRTPAVSAD
jgi:hypothetical protein